MKIKNQLLLITLIFLFFGKTFGQMVILSGPEKGSYNSFTGDIVKVLGEKSSISLINLPTGGSGYNFKELSDPRSSYKIALIQSDYLNLMEAQDKLNSTSKTGSLKVVLQLAREELHMVSRKSSGFVKLQDLDKKKVAIGSEDQGSFATGKIMRERSKINWTSVYTDFDQMLKDLSLNNIDAFLTVGSAPLNYLDVDPQIMIDGLALLELEDFNGWAKYYENDTIKKSDYKWLERDIPTFGVRTLLVVNESKLSGAEKQTVEAIKSGIIQNLDLLRKQGHPKWKEVIIPDEEILVKEPNIVTANTQSRVAADPKDIVTYRVQIYSRNYQKKDDRIDIGGRKYETYVYSYLGAFRYTIGEFTNFASASELQEICRESGFKEAFVAAFKNNIRSTDISLFK